MPISDTLVSANFEGLARLVGLTTPTSSRAPRDMAVLQTDDVGRITMMNAQAQALLKPEGATTGTALVRVFSKELPLGIESYTTEVRASATGRSFQLTLTPLLDGDTIQGYSVMLAPVTLPVANQQMWLQRLLNHANAMVCIRDQEGRYLMMNQMAEKILGLRPGSSIGLTDAMLEQPGWLDFQRETDEVMLRDGECPMSIQLIELMSGPVRLAVTKNLIQDELGNVMGSVLIGGILSQERSRNEMAHPRFMASLSHELRTPLNAVIGFSQLLLEDDLDEDQRDSVETILQSGRHILSLTEQILNMFSPRHTAARPESFPLCRLIEDCISMVTPLGHEKDVRLIIAPSGDIVMYQLRDNLRQVLLNLLSNAVKYNRAGGWVRVSACAEGDHVILSVEDNGVGIARENRDRLFQAFTRLEATAQMAEGTGLGLMITRNLVMRMGGSISIEDKSGPGSTFTVTLPVRYQKRLRG